MSAPRVDAYLICGGKYHDIDFARLELLKLLHEHEQIRVKVGNDFSDIEGIKNSDCLITYTCDVVPTEEEQLGLKAFLDAGNRWYALHGTNSILEWISYDPPKVGTPRSAPLFVEMLGNQFLAHPPIEPFTVEISDPEHPLVKGIEPFETTDELYLMEYHGDNTPLLHCDFNGTAEHFDHSDWNNDEPRLVFYLHPYGKGEVLYLTLGHCRGKYDMQPLMEEWPSVDRCSWELPVYYELLRRGIRWAGNLD
jgi:type 1 glutamine amidotransferase